METLKIQEPAILSANTYFWQPKQSAASRRANEKRHLKLVEDYLVALGFEVSYHNSLKAVLGEVVVYFNYSESCKNVYKHLEVYKNGKKSNITAIRKIAAAKS